LYNYKSNRACTAGKNTGEQRCLNGEIGSGVPLSALLRRKYPTGCVREDCGARPW
jgi:hypothetical protein